MNSICEIKEIDSEEGFRIAKVEQYGLKTVDICEGFGEDTYPLPESTAVMLETENNGNPVLIGYIFPDKKTALGEKRSFSLKEDGSISAYIWFRNNGNLEFNGNDDNLVKYAALKAKCDELENFITTELTKIQTAITGVGGAYTPAILNFDISGSKSNDLLCKK